MPFDLMRNRWSLSEKLVSHSQVFNILGAMQLEHIETSGILYIGDASTIPKMEVNDTGTGPQNVRCMERARDKSVTQLVVVLAASCFLRAQQPPPVPPSAIVEQPTNQTLGGSQHCAECNGKELKPVGRHKTIRRTLEAPDKSADHLQREQKRGQHRHGRTQACWTQIQSTMLLRYYDQRTIQPEDSVVCPC
ncbi:hypothetical protein EDC04DRAFT_2715181 [Pisolithus marmoratus]|nr:hypothetical protein EDC04DRAFT_2715181 [Pisolithus marmoratus]